MLLERFINVNIREFSNDSLKRKKESMNWFLEKIICKSLQADYLLIKQKQVSAVSQYTPIHFLTSLIVYKLSNIFLSETRQPNKVCGCLDK